MYAMTDIGDVYIDGVNSTGVSLDSETMLIGAAYKMGKFTPKAKYSVSSFNKANQLDAEDKTLIAVGLDYALGKKTTGYVDYVAIDNADYGTDKTENNTVSVGLLHKF
jgi:predicted porin